MGCDLTSRRCTSGKVTVRGSIAGAIPDDDLGTDPSFRVAATPMTRAPSAGRTTGTGAVRLSADVASCAS